MDRNGRTVQLGKLIGKGGEGSVFHVEGQPSLAAKVYHRTPLAADHLEKLEAMVACRSSALVTISAWPESVLYSCQSREACGILLPKIVDGRQLHELYGTSNRRRHYPEAHWQHLVLAARNVAASFDSFHGAGIVVGDVNQGNLLVDNKMCVRFIDCDSFQISHNGRTFFCPVGTPHFTPPELQSKNLRETPRTADHDRFGMAVLLFHLLFVGRHPFAGRFRGAGELNIEKAIAQRRFAFSRDTAATLVEPPPFSLLLDHIPAPLGELFEWAFRGRPNTSGRPTAEQWVHQLDALLKTRKGCSFDPAHVYYGQLKQCPWCRIEDEGGPEFFVLVDSVSTIADRLGRLEERLSELKTPRFPELAASQLTIPHALDATWSASIRFSVPDVAGALLGVSVVLCLAGMFSIWAVAVGTAGALLGGGLLAWRGKARRDRLSELTEQLVQQQNQLWLRAEAVTAAHRQRQAMFDHSLADVKAQLDHYHAADTKLQDVLVFQRMAEKNRFLASHLIQEHVAHIPGMSFALASILQSYGIESALDIESMRLMGLPMLTPVLTMELMNWRESVERDFVFKPDHGVSLGDMNAARDMAVNRFKIYQAKRILMNAKHLDSMASAGREQLTRDVNQFVQSAVAARDAAVELRNFQSGRHALERLLNHSYAAIAGVSLAAPAVGWLLYWLFG